MFLPIVPIPMSPETERWRTLHRSSLVPTHKAGADSLPEPSLETCQQGISWATIIGRIVSFTPDPDSISGCLPSAGSKRYSGTVLSVQDCGDFQGLPTCLATIVGRTGKQLTINFTECYAKTHDSWAEAERST